jgi:hypothetical protein
MRLQPERSVDRDQHHRNPDEAFTRPGDWRPGERRGEPEGLAVSHGALDLRGV